MYSNTATFLGIQSYLMAKSDKINLAHITQLLFLPHYGEIGTRLVELREFPIGSRSSIFRQSRGNIRSLICFFKVPFKSNLASR